MTVEDLGKLEELQGWAHALTGEQLAGELRELAAAQGTGRRTAHGPDARWALLCEAALRIGGPEWARPNG